MTSRSIPEPHAERPSVLRRLYAAVCWTTLVATVAAACLGIALLAGTVLHAVWPG